MRRLFLTLAITLYLAGCTSQGTAPVSTQPKKTTAGSNITAAEFERKKECLRLCDPLSEQDKSEAEILGGTTLSPQYAYNAKLNTCLYVGGTFSRSNGVPLRVQHVKDYLTNKVILNSLQEGGEEPLGLTPSQFRLQADALMAGE